MSVGDRPSSSRKRGVKRSALWGVALLAAAVLMAYGAVTVSRNNRIAEENARIMADTAALAGVSVGGVDISEMTGEQAREATAALPDSLLASVRVAVDVGGEVRQYTAYDLGVTTDCAAAIEKAFSYGHTGTLEERKAAILEAQAQGMDFPVTLQTDKEKILAALLPLKSAFDKAPVDASYTFTPWGHLPDGTPYEPDKEAIIEACASGKEPELPALARIAKEDMPNKLRYLFWKNTQYVDGYIPKDADISRFTYTEGENGRSVDIEAAAGSIISAVQSGDYAVITAPVVATEPEVTVADLKKNTQLVSSWTSSYSRHAGYNRNWNVAKLSGLVNGVVMQPQEEWSINRQAGPRSLSTGWKEAAGIFNGGYTQQAGGGVCQISSTVYNAAIRSALEITDSTHHSISSDYIPLGLDATISTGAPDLKIKNPYGVPVYMVSYVNPKDKNVTVEIYGPTVADPQFGDVILNFSFEDGGSFGAPKMLYYYDTAMAPDDTMIAPGESYKFAEARPGRKVQTYIHYLSPDGAELKKDPFHAYKWDPINGKTYVNGPDPAQIPVMAASPELVSAR